jgi:ribosomal protein S21
MVEFTRQTGESFEAFLRRFNRGLKNSKKLMAAKQKLFIRPKKNKRKTKEEALIKQKTREKMDYLRKTGQLPKGK